MVYNYNPKLSPEANAKLKAFVEQGQDPVKSKRKKPVQKEAMIQRAFVKWLDFKGIDEYYAIPNGGRRDRITACLLKAEGVRSGVPDFCIPIPTPAYHGLYIEIKYGNDNYASPEQKAKVAQLNKRGYCARVCKGLDNLIGLTTAYLTGRKIQEIEFKVGYSGKYFQDEFFGVSIRGGLNGSDK